MKLKQNKTTQKCTDPVFQSKMMHPSMRIPACTSATRKPPCQLNRVRITHWMSVFCSQAGESALHTELAGGRWSTFPQEHEAATVESALQSSRPSSEGTGISFLLWITLSKPIQSHLVSICLCKGLFCPKNKATPPSTLLSMRSMMQKTRIMENDRSAKKPTPLYNK